MLDLVLGTCLATVAICFATIVALGTIFISYCFIKMMIDKEF